MKDLAILICILTLIASGCSTNEAPEATGSGDQYNRMNLLKKSTEKWELFAWSDGAILEPHEGFPMFVELRPDGVTDSDIGDIITVKLTLVDAGGNAVANIVHELAIKKDPNVSYGGQIWELSDAIHSDHARREEYEGSGVTLAEGRYSVVVSVDLFGEVVEIGAMQLEAKYFQD